MTDQILPRVASAAEPSRQDKLLPIVIIGAGGIATFCWIAFLGWGAIYLISCVTG